MMLPMERTEVFKILSDIFRQGDIKRKMLLTDIMMRESTGEPYDIDFWYEKSTCNPSDIDLLFDGTPSLVGHLRIVNPPKDCVDGEYCFVYHSSISQKDANIAIDSFGNIRVYGDDISSFIYKAIKDNATRLADYAKKLTRTYQNQVADTVVNVVKTYCEALMNVYANTFDQMDESVSEGFCTNFIVRAINEPESNFQFSVLKHIYEFNIIDNEIWVRFSKPGTPWLWTPIIIKPSVGDIVINTEKYVFTNIFGGKEVVGLARSISEQTGFVISIKEVSSSRDQHVAKYIKSLLQKHEVLDTLKQAKEKMNNENNKNIKVNTILDMKAHIDSLVDKKLKKFVESGSLVYMTKDYLTDQILNQLKIDWHKDVYRSIYSSVWCTLAESRFKNAAFEFEKHFMEYVTLDYVDCFTVIFELQKIDDNLPGIEIKFYTSTQDIYVRMLDYKSSVSATWSLPLIELKSEPDESKVYFDTFKKTDCTYKAFLANVISKIVLLEGLS